MKKYRRVLIALGVILLVLFALTRSREPEIAAGSTLVVILDGQYVESTTPTLLNQLLGDAGVPFVTLRSELKKAERDDRIANVLLRLRTPQLGWAQAQELRGLISDLKGAGKHTAVHLEIASFVSNVSYYIATAADEIWVSPAAAVGVIGLAGEYFFLGEPMEELGIVFDVARVGRYKSFADTVTRTSMSEAFREQANSLLDSVNDHFVAGIAEGRELTKEFVERAIDTAPMSPSELKGLDFVDSIGSFEEQLESLGGSRVNADLYARVDPATVGFAPVARFALIYGSGNVVLGRGQKTPSGGLVMASDTVSKAFADAASDPSISAIIFRIDSPGGSALASDLIWQAVDRSKSHGKPVIASMVNAAASGGYYAAGAADAIVASPSTITGSIGVVAIRPGIHAMLEKLEIRVEVLARGEHADMFVMSKPMSAASRARFEEQVHDMYALFLDRVAAGREMSPEQVDAVGQGRVWTGQQALDNGLVDAIGGLTEALALAKKRAGLDPEADVALVPFPPPQSLPEQLTSGFGQVVTRATTVPSLPGLLGRVQSWLGTAVWGTPMLLPPFVVEIR